MRRRFPIQTSHSSSNIMEISHRRCLEVGITGNGTHLASGYIWEATIRGPSAIPDASVISELPHEEYVPFAMYPTFHLQFGGNLFPQNLLCSIFAWQVGFGGWRVRADDLCQFGAFLLGESYGTSHFCSKLSFIWIVTNKPLHIVLITEETVNNDKYVNKARISSQFCTVWCKRNSLVFSIQIFKLW